jgi:hypothetical protein
MLINDKTEDLFNSFLLNSHYTTDIIKKTPSVEEFYIKDDLYCYYFIKAGILSFIIIFLKETSFYDMQNVKVLLKSLRDFFIDKEENIY